MLAAAAASALALLLAALAAKGARPQRRPVPVRAEPRRKHPLDRH